MAFAIGDEYGDMLVNQMGQAAPDKEALEANYRACDEQWAAGETEITARPRVLTIETTQYCNISCVMCTHGLEDTKAKRAHFPRELVPRLREVIDGASIIQLHGEGEPMMNPAFWDMLALTHASQHVCINSNGVLFNAANIGRILDSHLSEISFSLDAATPETYRKIRGADFGKVVGNIRALIEERNRRGQDGPMVSMNMTLMRENVEEAPLFVDLVHELGAHQAQFWHLNGKPAEETWRVERDGWTFDYHAQMLSESPALSNRMIREAQKRADEKGIPLYLDWAKTVFFDEEEKGAAPDAAEPPANEPGPQEQPGPKECSSPWNWMLVGTNGDIKPCCFGPGVLGNLNERTALEIWNGQPAVRLRTTLLDNRIDRLCSGGVCRFVGGRRSPDDPGDRAWSGVLSGGYVKAKRVVRSAVGERAWKRMKTVYHSMRGRA